MKMEWQGKKGIILWQTKTKRVFCLKKYATCLFVQKKVQTYFAQKKSEVYGRKICKNRVFSSNIQVFEKLGGKVLRICQTPEL
ncbi:MAG: hypothetical protein RSH26_09340, partial [Clostridia bacterium]